MAAAKGKFCAYLYFRCADADEGHSQTQATHNLRVRREALFDLLSDADMGDVDALGNCRGLRQKPRSSLRDASSETQQVVSKRFASNWHDEAVDMFRDYKFCFAFENSDVDGYVSEKIANAMLADCVPIYAGSAAAGKMFNPASFIDCSPSAGNMLRLVCCVKYEMVLCVRHVKFVILFF